MFRQVIINLGCFPKDMVDMKTLIKVNPYNGYPEQETLTIL